MLFKRVLIIHEAIKDLEKKDVQQKIRFKQALNDTHQILKDVIDLLSKFKTPRNLIVRVLEADTDREEFEKMGQRMNESLTQLQLGLTIQIYGKMLAITEEEKTFEEKKYKSLQVNEGMIELMNESLVELKNIKQDCLFVK